jgi:hypothetical protein
MSNANENFLKTENLVKCKTIIDEGNPCRECLVKMMCIHSCNAKNAYSDAIRTFQIETDETFRQLCPQNITELFHEDVNDRITIINRSGGIDV